MKIFISHSHKDKPIVEYMTQRLIKNNIYIWLDSYEIEPNQSLRERIFSALEECSHFCFILSKNSITSKWCLEEIKLAIEKETEEGRKLVLPLSIDSCEIPDLLKDRAFFDFRNSFEDGFTKLLNYLKYESDKGYGSKYDDLYKIDFALDWGLMKFKPIGEVYLLEITSISFQKNKEYSILTKLSFIGEEIIVKTFNDYLKVLDESRLNDELIKMASDCIQKEPNKFSVIIKNGNMYKDRIELYWQEKKTSIILSVQVKILGNRPDSDIIFDLGSIIRAIQKRR